jgi:hypothetical protein
MRKMKGKINSRLNSGFLRYWRRMGSSARSSLSAVVKSAHLTSSANCGEAKNSRFLLSCWFAISHGAGRNFTHTGIGTSTFDPVGVSSPVSKLIRKTTRLLPS